MLEADARRIAEALTERAGGAVTAEARSSSLTPDGRPLPGGGRPTIVRYWIEVGDGSRAACLELDEATDLLDGLAAGTGSDGVFAAVAARGLQVRKVAG
jgi:hypothetical protein